uniref:Uncharacterized protein n=1 Tax=Rhizophora mucronata TaxID=61149 RepID=A0A2P2NQC0_RHIMU
MQGCSSAPKRPMDGPKQEGL